MNIDLDVLAELADCGFENALETLSVDELESLAFEEIKSGTAEIPARAELTRRAYDGLRSDWEAAYDASDRLLPFIIEARGY